MSTPLSPAAPAAPLPPDYIDPEHQGDNLKLLEAFYRACNAEGGTADEILLRGIRAVLAARPAAPAAPETPAEALAARPLLEQVARLSDCMGAHTVDDIIAISSRAADWLRDNPPGAPVAIEPRGCPSPGACSCVEPAPPAPEVGDQPVSQPYKLPENEYWWSPGPQGPWQRIKKLPSLDLSETSLQLINPNFVYPMGWLLPHHAIPLPQGVEGEA